MNTNYFLLFDPFIPDVVVNKSLVEWSQSFAISFIKVNQELRTISIKDQPTYFLQSSTQRKLKTCLLGCHGLDYRFNLCQNHSSSNKIKKGRGEAIVQ